MRLRNLLFEFEDLSWFPRPVREGMTDFLRYITGFMNLYEPVMPMIVKAIQQTNMPVIVDLCSGGGGPAIQMKKYLDAHLNKNITITLTDKFPNVGSFKALAVLRSGILYATETVDAVNVPRHLKGFRTIFSAIHHFDRPAIKSIIKNAAETGAGIGIFDGGDRNIFMVIAILILQPIAFFFFTPFIKPFRWSRLIFTYLIPLIPLCTVWDGIVSVNRLYQPGELLQMAKEAGNEKYTWQSGKLKNKWGMNVAYLIGYPATELF